MSTPDDDPNGWSRSALAWIADQGEHGDFGRRWVLDPVMLPRALAGPPREVLDVGCGEGRFCRMLAAHGVRSTGVDPTPELIAAARQRDAAGHYLEASAEQLPFDDARFDRVVSYLSLLDMPDARTGIAEMVRVLAPGGSLLIANMSGFASAGADHGWTRDLFGHARQYTMDHYLEERAVWIEYRGIRVLNHHRPLAFYMTALLEHGLRLVHFDEPAPIAGAPEAKAAKYRRVPWFVVMEWRKAG